MPATKTPPPLAATDSPAKPRKKHYTPDQRDGEELCALAMALDQLVAHRVKGLVSAFRESRGQDAQGLARALAKMQSGRGCAQITLTVSRGYVELALVLAGGDAGRFNLWSLSVERGMPGAGGV